MTIRNLFEKVDRELTEEWVDVLVESKRTRIERIVSRGHVTSEGEWYDQSAAEWVCLLAGSASLQFQKPDETVHLNPGDSVTIASHRKHRVIKTDNKADTIWLAVFFDE